MVAALAHPTPPNLANDDVEAVNLAGNNENKKIPYSQKNQYEPEKKGKSPSKPSCWGSILNFQGW